MLIRFIANAYSRIKISRRLKINHELNSIFVNITSLCITSFMLSLILYYVNIKIKIYLFIFSLIESLCLYLVICFDDLRSFLGESKHSNDIYWCCLCHHSNCTVIHALSVEGKINRGKECWNDALKRSDHCLLLSTSVWTHYRQALKASWNASKEILFCRQSVDCFLMSKMINF